MKPERTPLDQMVHLQTSLSQVFLYNLYNAENIEKHKANTYINKIEKVNLNYTFDEEYSLKLET